MPLPPLDLSKASTKGVRPMPHLALRPQSRLAFGHAAVQPNDTVVPLSTSLQHLPQGKVFKLAQQAHQRLLVVQGRLGTTQLSHWANQALGGPKALTPLHESALHPKRVFYKREDMTAIGAYKIRGAFNAMSHAMEEGQTRFVAASTGNHALGVLLAARVLKPNYIEMVVPKNTAPAKVQKIEKAIAGLNQMGVEAHLKKEGGNFDEAQRYAQAQQQHNRVHFLAPYSDTQVIAGQATVGLELVDQLTQHLQTHPHVNELTVVIPIGGGGLSRGVVATVREKMNLYNQAHPHQPVQTHFVGLQLKDPANQTKAGAINVLKADSQNMEALEAMGMQVHQLTDAQIEEGSTVLNRDLGQAVEEAAGTTAWAVRHVEKAKPAPNRVVVCVVSGGNV